MSPEDIVAIFAEALERFRAIRGQPTDADLHALREILYPILLDIPYDQAEGKHSLVALILDAAEYFKLYNATFIRPTRLGAYDSSIADDASNRVRAEAEAKWTAKRKDLEIFEVTERELRKFILAIVEDTWVRELKDANTFYTKVTGKALLDHLQASCLGTHAIDALTLQLEMRDYHVKAEGIPEYINLLEDAQRTAKRIDKDNPITNKSVLNIATNAMLNSQQFPRTNDEWEDLPADQKTWDGWKTLYKAAQGKERVRKLAAGGSESFGGANSANHSPAPSRCDSQGSLGKPEPVTLEVLEGCFDNLANAAKTERATMDELTKSIAVLTATNAELVATISKLTARIQKEGGGKKPWVGGDDVKPKKQPAAPCRLCEGEGAPNNGMHWRNECLEDPKNAKIRPAGWKSVL